MDNLLMACNNMDADLLDEVQRDPQIHYMDVELQKLIKKISLFEMNGEDKVEQQPVKTSEATQKASLFTNKKPSARQPPPPPPPLPEEPTPLPPQPATSSHTKDLLAKHLKDLDINDDGHTATVSNAELDDVMAGLEDDEDEVPSSNNLSKPATAPAHADPEPTVDEDEDDESRFL
jgi:hypothetical protein